MEFMVKEHKSSVPPSHSILFNELTMEPYGEVEEAIKGQLEHFAKELKKLTGKDIETVDIVLKFRHFTWATE